MHDEHGWSAGLKPGEGGLKGELRVIVLVLAGWLVAVLGSQLAIWYLERSLIEYWLSEIIFFNLPIHFWLSGQFLPLWFILLGVVFNLWMDRHEARTFAGSIRFRAKGRHREEVER